MRKGKDAGIARLLKSNGLDHAGMAILVDRRRVVTCAHVVNTALGRTEGTISKPDENVEIVFPLANAPRRAIKAIVDDDEWYPEQDIAVLRLLEEDAPAEVGYAVLAHFDASLDNDPLKIFGCARGENRHVDVKYQGMTASVEVQLDGDRAAENFVEGGYSGAGVWNSKHNAFIGMVRAISNDGRRTAFLIPMLILQRACTTLPIERRRLSSTFVRTWTISVLAFFGATFYFFGGNLWWTTFSHPQLAAFTGMHIYPSLGLFVAWLLFAYARDHQFHPWSTRVPKLQGLHQYESGSTEDIRWAATLLVLLQAFPVYAQVHFLKQFHKEGHVYIYPRDFGFTAAELNVSVPKVGCLKGSLDSGTIKCPHPQAGLYSTVEPRPPAKGGYWINKYHYGDYREEGRQSANFYPKLQPWMILILSVATLAFNGWTLWFVLSDHRERLWRRRVVS